MSFLNKSNETALTQTKSVSIMCAFHQEKIITNFCSKQSCLLPMCPSCVAIHSQQHRQQSTYGQFQKQKISEISIQDVISSISLRLLKINKFLQDLSQQYTEDYWNKQKILQSCKETLYNQKRKFIKQIERKFDDIQHTMRRKINEFQDKIHDRYKQLESEIQYIYQTVIKQQEDFIPSNQKILKNLICFYCHKKDDKLKQWQVKFRQDVNELKRKSIRLDCNNQLFDMVRTIDYYFVLQEFKDDQNQYLISSGSQLISSTTKRKTVESPRWNQEKQNHFTVRNSVKNFYSHDTNKSIINELNEPRKLHPDPEWLSGKI